MKEKLKKLLRQPAFWIFCGGALVLSIVAAYAAYRMGVTPAVLKAKGAELLAAIQDKPVLLFLAMAILPAFPIPIFPMLLAVGAVFLPVWGPWWAVLYALTAMAVNMSWVWFVAAYPGRRAAAALLKQFDVTLPEPDSTRGYVPLLVLLRFTPGVPFFLQNILLGFLRVPFPRYLLLSVAICAINVYGFVVVGGAILQGKAGLAIGAVAVIALGMFIAARFRGKSTANTQSPAPISKPALEDGSAL